MVRATSLSTQPSSANGTNNGQARSITIAVGSILWIAFVYAPLFTVDSVALTPIGRWVRGRLVRSSSTRAIAARAPGPITPTTSIFNAERIAGSANADAVLQATTSSLFHAARGIARSQPRTSQ